MEALSPWYTNNQPKAAQMECLDRDNCTAFIHYQDNNTLLLWNGTPSNTSVGGLAAVVHPLCLVKVNVFDRSIRMQGKPCKCEDGTWPALMCNGQTMVWSEQAGQDCADGSKPTNECQDGSTCQVIPPPRPPPPAGSTTTTTTSPAQGVKVTYTITNLDYSKVETNATLKNEIIDAVKEGVLASLTGYAKSDIVVALSTGSIVAEVTIPAKGDTTTEALNNTIAASKAAMETSVTTKVTQVEGVDKALSPGMTLNDVSATSVVEVGAPSPPAAPSPPSDTPVSGTPLILSRWKALAIFLTSTYAALVAC